MKPFFLCIMLSAAPFFLRAGEDLLDRVRRAPEIAALRQKAEAARRRADVAGLYPDPEVETRISRADQPNGEEVPMLEIVLRQPLPKRGERVAEAAVARAQAEMLEAEADRMTAELLADAAMSLINVETVGRRVEWMSKQVERLEQALAAFDARIGTGGGELGGKLRLQNELSAMRLLIDDEMRMWQDELDDLRARLGLAAEEILPEIALPDVERMDVENAPERRLLRARLQEAEAMARMAEASARPMTALALRYEREEESMGNVETVGVAFMAELPFRARRRARAEVSAAGAEGRAVDAELELFRRKGIALAARVERAEQYALRVRQNADETLVRLNAEVDALLRAAGVSGMKDSLSVLMYSEQLDRITENEIRAINAEAEARKSRAALWRYVPFSQTRNSKESP